MPDKKKTTAIPGQPDNSTSAIASEYDSHIRTVVPFYEMLTAEVFDLIAALKPAPEVWLDTGCGTGYLVEQALKLFPRTQFVLADPSSAMLDVAKSRLKDKGEGRVHFLPAANSSDLSKFTLKIKPQVITAILCHHYLKKEEKLGTIKTCYELLNNGGVYLTVEHTMALNEAARQINMARWRRFQLDQGRSEPEVDKHLARCGTAFFPITAAEQIQLLLTGGFHTAEVYWQSFVSSGFYALKA